MRHSLTAIEDLEELDEAAFASVVKHVTDDALAAAFKAMSNDLRNRFLGAISETRARKVVDLHDELGAMRIADVRRAQSTIIDSANRELDLNRFPPRLHPSFVVEHEQKTGVILSMNEYERVLAFFRSAGPE